jgi:Anaphase-promoting complex, cyclosome, subunit 3/SPOR domain/WD40-like Beta Propeller Repeat
MKFYFLALSLWLCSAAALSAQSKMEQATKQFELQSYAEATTQLREVLNENSKNAVAISLLAECYFRTYRDADALQLLSSALQVENMPTAAHLLYGQLLLSAGRYDEAVTAFGKVGRINPPQGNRMIAKTDWAKLNRDLNAEFVSTKSPISSTGSDYSPSFLKNKLVWASTRAGVVRKANESETTWTGDARSQLVEATLLDEGKAAKVVSGFHSDLKNVFREGPVAFSGDGTRAVISRNNFAQGMRQLPLVGDPMILYTAKLNQDEEWTELKPFPLNIAGYSTGFGFLNADGRTMLFASDRPGGYGGFDLYRSTFNGTTWTNLENLGPVVNSPGNEIAPFQVDGVLYFSSDWFDGFGWQDVFFAVPKNGSFERPVNMGLGVNSAQDDYGFIYRIEEGYGYVTSNRAGAAGLEDIYYLSLPKRSIAISVKDLVTGQPLPQAVVDLSDCNNQLHNTDKQGNLIQTIAVSPCKATISMAGYESIETSLVEGQTAWKLNLQPLEVFVSGKLTSTATQKGLPGITVTALDAKNKAKSVKTDQNGVYTFKIPIRTNVQITTATPGYLESKVGVKIDVKPIANVDIPLIEIPKPKPVEVVAQAKPAEVIPKPKPALPEETPKQPAQSRPPVLASVDPKFLEIGGVKPVDKTPATMPEKPVVTAKGPVGFSIQVKVTESAEVLDLSAYEDISGLGNLYLLNDDGRSKIRIGVFATREAANTALGKIKKNPSYKDAFVVAETDPGMTKMTVKAPGKPAEPLPEQYENALTTKGDDPAKSPWRIQVGVYKNIENVNMDGLAKIGIVRKVPNAKGLTTIYVVGYQSQEAANAHLPLVKKLGYSSAFVEESK